MKATTIILVLVSMALLNSACSSLDGHNNHENTLYNSYRPYMGNQIPIPSEFNQSNGSLESVGVQKRNQ